MAHLQPPFDCTLGLLGVSDWVCVVWALCCHLVNRGLVPEDLACCILLLGLVVILGPLLDRVNDVAGTYGDLPIHCRMSSCLGKLIVSIGASSFSASMFAEFIIRASITYMLP